MTKFAVLVKGGGGYGADKNCGHSHKTRATAEKCLRKKLFHGIKSSNAHNHNADWHGAIICLQSD